MRVCVPTKGQAEIPGRRTAHQVGFDSIKRQSTVIDNSLGAGAFEIDIADCAFVEIRAGLHLIIELLSLRSHLELYLVESQIGEPEVGSLDCLDICRRSNSLHAFILEVA